MAQGRVIERGEFAPTEEGTPQGGVISPLLLNVALHGMEQAAGVRYRNSARSDAETVTGCPVLVRYADDYVAMCLSREQAEKVKAAACGHGWHREGCLQRGQDAKSSTSRRVLVPGVQHPPLRRQAGRETAHQTQPRIGQAVPERLTTDVRSLHGANAAAVFTRSTPSFGDGRPTTGAWCSSQVFTGLDHHVWHLTYRWAMPHAPEQVEGWVATRYFGMFNKSRQDRWVFGDRATGAYLTKFSWTKIVRHVPVHAGASPDDPGPGRVLG